MDTSIHHYIQHPSICMHTTHSSWSKSPESDVTTHRNVNSHERTCIYISFAYYHVLNLLLLKYGSEEESSSGKPTLHFILQWQWNGCHIISRRNFGLWLHMCILSWTTWKNIVYLKSSEPHTTRCPAFHYAFRRRCISCQGANEMRRNNMYFREGVTRKIRGEILFYGWANVGTSPCWVPSHH
jgi:hypothetical protein